MKTKEVVYLLNQMHEQIKFVLREEQTRKLLASIPSKLIDK